MQEEDCYSVLSAVGRGAMLAAGRLMMSILWAVQVCKPKDFAQQINLNMDNCWGIVRALVDLCMKMEDGKYLIVKDPNKQLLRLYSIPEDAFQENYSEEPIEQAEEAVNADEPAKADAADEE